MNVNAVSERGRHYTVYVFDPILFSHTTITHSKKKKKKNLWS